MKLSVKAFGLSCGIVWGLVILLATWWLLFYGTPGELISKLESIYIGYTFTWFGGVIGMVWGFVSGFILGAVFAWLYNKLAGAK